MGLPRATAFRCGQGDFEAVFNFYFNSRRDQKRTRQIHALERVAILFLGLRHHARNAPSCFKSSPETMKPQKAGRVTQTSTCWTGEDHFLDSKKPVCLRPRKWDCCSDLFCENGAALTESNTLASVTEWQDSGEHGCWLKVSSPACMLPIFAKAPCCLELFGCCCRRLLQHGVGEVLIPLRHCWLDAFFCVCVGSGSFCHDWASHCSVLFWSLDALFVFGLPLPPFAPLDSKRGNFAGRVVYVAGSSVSSG